MRRRYVAPRLYTATPAAIRRRMTPATLARTTATRREAALTRSAVAMDPAAIAGATVSWTTRPITQAVPAVMMP
jgi:hypothetical protein